MDERMADLGELEREVRAVAFRLDVAADAPKGGKHEDCLFGPCRMVGCDACHVIHQPGKRCSKKELCGMQRSGQ